MLTPAPPLCTQLLLGYLQNSADASTLVSRALAGAAPSPAAGSPLGRPPTPPGAGAGVASPGGGGVGAGLFGVDPAAVRGYAQWWGSAVTEMAESLCTSPTLERLLWQGLTPRMLLAGTKLHLSTLSISQPVPSARGIEHALTRRLQLPLPESMLPELRCGQEEKMIGRVTVWPTQRGRCHRSISSACRARP